MAIQDDNTVLCKGDLKAYHEKILPYLGGNFMLGTNVSDYYSTDEKIVGVWTDGKPIYQKTIIPSTNYGTGNFVILANAKTALSIDQVVNIIGVETASSNGATFSLTENTTDYIGYDGTDFVLRKGNTGTTWIIKATFQYTKTTDAANSAAATPGCYDINRPDLWPNGQEIFFGNGLYGMRKKGTSSGSALAGGIALVSGVAKTAICWNKGGMIDMSGTGGTNWYDINGGWNAGGAQTQFNPLITNTSQVFRFYCQNNQGITSGNIQYDIWFTYTKA